MRQCSHLCQPRQGAKVASFPDREASWKSFVLNGMARDPSVWIRTSLEIGQRLAGTPWVRPEFPVAHKATTPGSGVQTGAFAVHRVSVVAGFIDETQRRVANHIRGRSESARHPLKRRHSHIICRTLHYHAQYATSALSISLTKLLVTSNLPCCLHLSQIGRSRASDDKPFPRSKERKEGVLCVAPGVPVRVVL